MVTEKEIGHHMLEVTKELIDIKQNKSNESSDLYNGILIGLMISLGKFEEFNNTDKNWLNFTNCVLQDIFDDKIKQ